MATATSAAPLSRELLQKMDAYWRAANYLSVGQIYLLANPLLLVGARFQNLRFKPSPVGDVSDEAREHPPVAQPHFADGQVYWERAAVLTQAR